MPVPKKHTRPFKLLCPDMCSPEVESDARVVGVKYAVFFFVSKQNEEQKKHVNETLNKNE